MDLYVVVHHTVYFLLLCTCFDQPDGALSGRDAVHVSLRSDAHRRSHGLSAGLQHLNGPFCLFDVLKVLTTQGGGRTRRAEPVLICSTRCDAQRHRRRIHLSNHKVHVLLHEHVQLLLEDGLHLRLALAAQVGRSLAHSPGDQGVSFVSDLPGEIACGLVDLCPLGGNDRETT